MSKDFAAGGLRLGCLYLRNKALMEAVSAVSQFSWSGPLSQLFATQMLEDEEWKSGFLERSKRVLKERYEKCTHILDDYGIEYFEGSNAGFFLWVSRASSFFLPEDGLADTTTGQSPSLPRHSSL